MKFRQMWFLAMIAIGVSTVHAAESLDPVAPQIVVTFTDRSLLRSEFGQPGGYYAPSADYVTSDWSRRVTETLARDYALVTATQWPILALGVHCVVFEVPKAQDVDVLIAKIASDTRVASVQRMNTFHVMNGDPYRPLQANLTSLSVNEAHRWAQGRNVTVAVVDTGIDANHPDLRGRVLSTTDLVTPGQPTSAADIHGTAVAGIIAAAADNGEGIVGVAPQASVVGLKACWPLQRDLAAAECNSLTLARGLSAVLKLKPQILNLSLTGPHDPLLSALLKLIIAQGIVVVAAEPADQSSGFPVDVEQVIRVNPSQSPLLDGPEVVGAPGTKVLTTFPGASYSFVNGSSFAAAHVSGVVALMKELKPDLTIAEIQTILQESSRDAPTSRTAEQQHASVSACAAVARLSSEVSCDPTTVIERATLYRHPATGLSAPPSQAASLVEPKTI
jgi:subtilisin family serine protease